MCTVPWYPPGLCVCVCVCVSLSLSLSLSHTHTQIQKSMHTQFTYIIWHGICQGFPGGSAVKKICLQGRRCGFNPWVRKIPWGRKWPPTPVSLPGKSHGQRSLTGCIDLLAQLSVVHKKYTYYNFPGGLVVKNPPADAEDSGDTGPVPGSGRSLGVGNGNPLWYSCLENSMDREAWRSAVQGIAKTRTQLSD